MQIFNVDTPDQFCDVPSGTVLLGYRGSIAHNMYIPNSDPHSIDDVDLMGIVIGEKHHYFGLREWGSRGTKEIKQGKYDCVYYEVRKAFSLLLQGNPNIVSLLWVRPDHFLRISAVGRRIVENRGLFVGKHMYNSFAGYASAQLQKMETREPQELRRYVAITNELKYRGAHPNHKGEAFGRKPVSDGIEAEVSGTSTEKLLQRLRAYQKKGENIGYLGDKRKQLVLDHGYDAKNAAHCIRLLRMCREFLETGEMNVYREKDSDELLDIKRGKWPLERVKQHAEDLFAAVKAARDRSELPEEPDRARAEELLVELIIEELKNTADHMRAESPVSDSQSSQNQQDAL